MRAFGMAQAQGVPVERDHCIEALADLLQVERKAGHDNFAIVPTANREKATVRVRVGFRAKDPRILPDMAVKVAFLDDVTSTTGKNAAAN